MNLEKAYKALPKHGQQAIYEACLKNQKINKCIFCGIPVNLEKENTACDDCHDSFMRSEAESAMMNFTQEEPTLDYWGYRL